MESPFSKCAIIPDGHRAHLRLKKGSVLYLWNMVWMMCAVSVLVKTDHLKLGKDVWEEGFRCYYIAVPIVLSERCCTELGHSGFTILHGMADPQVAGRGCTWQQESWMITCE